MDSYYELAKQGKLKTAEEFMEAIRENPMALDFVPEDILTEKMCFAAVKRDPSALNFVPEAFLSVELVTLCVCGIDWL